MLLKIKFNISLFLLIALLFSCKKDAEDTEIKSPTYNSPILLSVDTIKSSSNEILFKLNYTMLYESEGASRNLTTSSLPNLYEIYPYYFEIDSIESLRGEGNEPYSVAIMVDNSGDYKETDKYNLRFQGINGFMHRMSPINEYLISSYARDGLLKYDTLTIFGNGFYNKWNENAAKQFLAATELCGGTSSLFDALDKMIDVLDKEAANVRKKIFVLAHDPDDGKSALSELEIINKAKSKGISISFIWNSGLAFEYAKISCETNGFSAACHNNQAQLSTVLLALNKILNNEINYYQATVSLKTKSGVIPQDFSLDYWFDLVYDEETYYYYFYFTL